MLFQHLEIFDDKCPGFLDSGDCRISLSAANPQLNLCWQLLRHLLQLFQSCPGSTSPSPSQDDGLRGGPSSRGHNLFRGKIGSQLNDTQSAACRQHGR